MANLAQHQKLNWIAPNLPFGSGIDGAYSSATIPTLTKDSCSGTAGTSTLTTSGSTFANNDVLLVHQTRGTSVGVWEITKVLSGGGTATLTLLRKLVNTYTDSGASQAQAIKIPQYTDVTVQSGTWTIPAWGGNTGGILTFAFKGTLTITGTATGNGGDGSTGSGGVAGGTGGGFYGGASHGSPGVDGPGGQGEGTAGAGGSQINSANGNGGGGGGTAGTGASGGAGGGNGVAGTNSTNGIGGTVGGAADLTTIVFGGGGGGAGKQTTYAPGSGGSGAAIVMIFGKTVATITGAINLIGGNGGASNEIGGGGGAGGSCLIVCNTATLGTNKVTATGGSGGSGGGNYAGGTGRVAVHHSGTVTGTTNPTFTDVTDTSLVENSFLGAMI